MEKETKKRIAEGRKCCKNVWKEKPCPIQVENIFWCRIHFLLFKPHLWKLVNPLPHKEQ